MRFLGSVVFGTVLAGAGLAYYVHDRSARTGQSYLEVLRLLPGDARHAYDDVRRRATLAVDEGLKAAQLREREVDRELTTAGAGTVGSG